jgi:hypothetical protein
MVQDAGGTFKTQHVPGVKTKGILNSLWGIGRLAVLLSISTWLQTLPLTICNLRPRHNLAVHRRNDECRLRPEILCD